jgi:hypothetical protein
MLEADVLIVFEVAGTPTAGGGLSAGEPLCPPASQMEDE